MLHGKPSMPDRRQRTFLRKLRATELLHIFLPLMRLRASRSGFWDEATRVLGILEASVQKEGPPNRAKLSCDDAEYLREILTRMSFGSLMTMLLHNLGPSTLVTNARHELETLRQMLPSHA
ncbi:RPL35 [Symbiodinium natans]|uniref:RPL35 protein n=1 Tax=Symbiodinium natans TaxID=878477 RepID=A0A812QTP3_9DINO|nr:RPL35 [Symbiodinium natans]